MKAVISDRSQSFPLNYELHKISVRGKSSVSLAFQTVSGITAERVDTETSYTGVIPVEILPLAGKFEIAVRLHPFCTKVDKTGTEDIISNLISLSHCKSPGNLSQV